MIFPMWRYALASVEGTSHLRSGTPCQDRSACRTFQIGEAEYVLVAVVSDGAGSATHSDVGAELACSLLVNEMEALFETGGSVSDITQSFIEEWLIRFQNEITIRADSQCLKVRDYACTIVAAIVGSHSAAFLQIGDGAIVVPSSEEPDEYCWIFWPQKGEYENTTFFATDPSAQEHLDFTLFNYPIDEVALFTDGLQRLVLNFDTQEAHSRFFGPMLAPVRLASEGHSENLSSALARYLASEAVNERTDDDKTLILATRRVNADRPITVDTTYGRKEDANSI